MNNNYIKGLRDHMFIKKKMSLILIYEVKFSLFSV